MRYIIESMTISKQTEYRSNKQIEFAETLIANAHFHDQNCANQIKSIRLISLCKVNHARAARDHVIL